MTEREYSFWLCMIPGLGREKYKGLLERYGSAESVAGLKAEELALYNEYYKEHHFSGENQLVTGSGKGFLNESLIDRILKKQKYLEYYANLLYEYEEAGIHFIRKRDAEYPEKLKYLTDAPEWLFAKGAVPLAGRPSVAIVGARGCSSYGRETAQILAYELTRNGIDVISGLACGIDQAAHEGAITYLKEGKAKEGIFQKADQKGQTISCDSSSLYRNTGTYAVLGSGVDVCYPNENASLYYDMTHGYGGVLSEYVPGDKPLSWHFPYRNRIISGLADVVCVVEARMKSGSLITADAALEQEKTIYAVPGRITDPLSQGCNYLIYQGAGILTDIKSFIEYEFKSYTDRQKKYDFQKLEDRKKHILQALGSEELHLETIAERMGISFFELALDLDEMVEMGILTECGLNIYRCKFVNF